MIVKLYQRTVENIAATEGVFKEGDLVRISKHKGIFDKGYTPNWLEEYFKVIKVISREPIVYKIEDLNGEPVKGIFYKEELQHVVKSDDYYFIDKILRKRELNGKIEYFVSWRGFPPSFNSWVTEDDVKRIK